MVHGKYIIRYVDPGLIPSLVDVSHSRLACIPLYFPLFFLSYVFPSASTPPLLFYFLSTLSILNRHKCRKRVLFHGSVGRGPPRTITVNVVSPHRPTALLFIAFSLTLLEQPADITCVSKSLCSSRRSRCSTARPDALYLPIVPPSLTASVEPAILRIAPTPSGRRERALADKRIVSTA